MPIKRIYTSGMGTLWLEAHEDGHALDACFTMRANDDVYEAKLAQREIIALHKVFIGMPEYLADFITHEPKISWRDGANPAIIASFNIREGKYTYLFDLELNRTHTTLRATDEAQKISELNARVAKLEHQITERDGRIIKLAIIGLQQLIGAEQQKVDEYFGLLAMLVTRKDINEAGAFARVAFDVDNDLYERMVVHGLIDVNATDGYDTSLFFELLDDYCLNDITAESAFRRAQFMLEHGLDVLSKDSSNNGIIEAIARNERYLHRRYEAACIGDRKVIMRRISLIANLKACALAQGAK